MGAKRKYKRRKRSKRSKRSAIRVGSEYQADIPDCISAGPCPESMNDYYGFIWAPCSTIDDETLDKYMNEAKEKHEYTEEQSLGVLFYNQYDMEKAKEEFVHYAPVREEWSEEDKALFEEGFKSYGKNFNDIHRMLPGKTIKSLIEYYYSRKKKSVLTSHTDEQIVKLSTHDGKVDERKKKMLCIFTENESTSSNLAQSKPKLPAGMYCNSEDLATVMTGTNVEKDVSQHSVDYELVSLKKEIQDTKQMVSRLQQKLSRIIDADQPTEGEKQINNTWTNDECLLAIQGMRRYGRNFKAIAELIETKNEGHIENFYINFCQRFNLDYILQEHDAECNSAEKITEEKEYVFRRYDSDSMMSFEDYTHRSH